MVANNTLATVWEETQRPEPQATYLPPEGKVYKIAEGIATDTDWWSDYGVDKATNRYIDVKRRSRFWMFYRNMTIDSGDDLQFYYAFAFEDSDTAIYFRPRDVEGDNSTSILFDSTLGNVISASGLIGARQTRWLTLISGDDTNTYSGGQQPVRIPGAAKRLKIFLSGTAADLEALDYLAIAVE
jgi:hypothetical protein